MLSDTRVVSSDNHPRLWKSSRGQECPATLPRRADPQSIVRLSRLDGKAPQRSTSFIFSIRSGTTKQRFAMGSESTATLQKPERTFGHLGILCTPDAIGHTAIQR